jgi:predicted transposase YdaD
MLLDLKDAELKKTRFYQEVYAEGHGEGREEGRHGEALALVLRLLRRRLGPLPGGTEDRITTLCVDQIEALGEAMLDFARPAELTEWLREHG